MSVLGWSALVVALACGCGTRGDSAVDMAEADLTGTEQPDLAMAVCGNGVVEGAETCDGDCPASCDDSNVCTTDTLTGEANACSAMCTFTPLTVCQNGDTCCPSSCTLATDNDCPPGQPVTQFFVATIAEGYLVANTTFYHPLSQSEPGLMYINQRPPNLVAWPAAGAFTHLRAYLHGGELDPGETLTFTLQKCTGGDPSTCAWQDTELEVIFAGQAGTADVSVSDIGSVATAPGDFFMMKVQTGADQPEGGGQEHPDFYLEWTGTNNDESVLTAGHAYGTGPNRFLAPTGGGQGLQPNADRVKVPLPDAFKVDGLYVGMTARPATTALNMYVCVDDGGATDANCGSQGRTVMSCAVPTGNVVPTCSATTCADSGTGCTYARGARLFLRQDRVETGSGVSAALRLKNGNQRWMSGVCAFVNSNEVEMTMSGFVSPQCTPTVDEQYCGVQLATAATARAIEARLGSALTAGVMEMDLRVNRADSNPQLRCTLSNLASTCSANAQVTLAADATYNLQMTPTVAPSPAFTPFCASVLWQDMR